MGVFGAPLVPTARTAAMVGQRSTGWAASTLAPGWLC